MLWQRVPSSTTVGGEGMMAAATVDSECLAFLAFLLLAEVEDGAAEARAVFALRLRDEDGLCDED